MKLFRVCKENLNGFEDIPSEEVNIAGKIVKCRSFLRKWTSLRRKETNYFFQRNLKGVTTLYRVLSYLRWGYKLPR